MSLKKISGYTMFLKEVLGKGSYGSVYKGEQDSTKRPCAIKMLSKKDIDSDQYLKQALFTQIQVLKSIKSQNVVGFFEVMESSQNYYIVQELCDGDLEHLLEKEKKERGSMQQQKAIQILKQITNGFLALVRQGIVHRDLKPANIMLSHGVVKIGDFGFAKKNPNQRVKNETAVGTPLYMCVQILKAEPYTSKCDIWALGFIFYEMLHGYTPWTASTEFELVRNIENKPLKINPNLSQKTIDFLTKTLKVKEAERINWDSLFLHPIFNNYFNKFSEENLVFENKMKKVMGDLRFIVNSQNIDLKRHFDKLGFKDNQQLDFKSFQKFIRTVNPNISGEEEVYMFQKLDLDNNNSISLKQLEDQMQKNNISLTSKFKEHIPTFNRSQSLNINQQAFGNNIHEPDKGLTNSLMKKVKECFEKLYRILTNKKITLYTTFCSFDSDKSGQLTLNEFSTILKRLDGSLGDQQIRSVFDFIDEDKSKTISFDEFNSYYCKVNGIPLSMDLPPEYYYMKMQQKNIYYQQMNNKNNSNGGSGFVMGKLQQAFHKNKS